MALQQVIIRKCRRLDENFTKSSKKQLFIRCVSYKHDSINTFRGSNKRGHVDRDISGLTNRIVVRGLSNTHNLLTTSATVRLSHGFFALLHSIRTKSYPHTLSSSDLYRL